MVRQRIAFLCMLAAALFVLVACDPEPLPVCEPSDLIAPVLTSPASYSNVGTGPTTGSLTYDLFQWEFGADCVPEHYKIFISLDRHFVFVRQGMTDGETTWPLSSQSAQAPLEPATEYFWNVRAWTDGVSGPDSATGVFFTGPFCETVGAMGSPELISPDDGEVLDTPFAELHYQPGGSTPCVPEGYYIDLQTDPAFGGTNLLGEYGIPGTYLLTDELADCTTYYWRVAPMYGGTQGPFSTTRSFSVSVSPTCMISYAPELIIDPSLLELCGPEDLEAPIPLVPEHNVLLWGSDLDVILFPEFFQWQPVGCAPELYKVYFSSDPDFGWSRVGTTEGETTWPDPDAEWPQMGLEPATQYFWYVRGWSDGTLGPTSPVRIFLTGPMCNEPANLVAPELLEPADGESVGSVNVQLHYEPGDPGCVPETYYIDLQTDPTFSGTSLLDAESPGFWHFFIASGLEDCTAYYWRVAAIEDGVMGPYSDSYSFFTNESGICMQSMIPQIEALWDLPCYSGPGSAYPIVGYFLGGETANVVAQSLNQQWWYIENPDAQDICAVPQEGTEPLGDMSGVPLWNDPEPAAACGTYSTQGACVEAGCRWVPNVTTGQGGYCTDP